MQLDSLATRSPHFSRPCFELLPSQPGAQLDGRPHTQPRRQWLWFRRRAPGASEPTSACLDTDPLRRPRPPGPRGFPRPTGSPALRARGAQPRGSRAPDPAARSPRLRSMATTEDRPEVTSGVDEWKSGLYDAVPERQGELFSTISGLDNEPLYAPENTAVDYDRDLGYP